jgi:hypothetical protein
MKARQQHEEHLNEFGRKGINKELQYGEIDESMVNELRAAGLSDSEIYMQIQQQKAADVASRPPKPYAKRLTGSQQRALDRQRSEAGGRKGPSALTRDDKFSSPGKLEIRKGTANYASNSSAAVSSVADSKTYSDKSNRTAIDFQKGVNVEDMKKRRARMGSPCPGTSSHNDKLTCPELQVRGSSVKSRTSVVRDPRPAESLDQQTKARGSKSSYSFTSDSLPVAKEVSGRGSETSSASRTGKSAGDAIEVVDDDDVYTLRRPADALVPPSDLSSADQPKLAAYVDQQNDYDEDEALNMALQLSLSEQETKKTQQENGTLYRVEEPPDGNSDMFTDDRSEGIEDLERQMNAMDTNAPPAQLPEYDDELTAQMLAFADLEGEFGNGNMIPSMNPNRNTAGDMFKEADRMREEMRQHMQQFQQHAGAVFSTFDGPSFGPNFDHFGDLLSRRVVPATTGVPVRRPLQTLDQPEVDDDDEAFARALQNSLDES